MKTFILGLLVSGAAAGLAGCGGSSTTDATARATAAPIDGSKYLLADEPEDAVGVIEARESAQDGAAIVVVGRIGGAANPWIEGRAAFRLIDASMAMVAEGEDNEEGELCTGDCCAASRRVGRPADRRRLKRAARGESRRHDCDSRQGQ
jgi:hypothetical protein